MNKLRKSKILVVDDEKLIRLTLSKILSDAGYDVETAENAEEAKELFTKTTFDLMLTDVVMKGMSGIQLLHYIKEVSSETIVIIMTAYASLDSTLEALRQGAYDYIIKPCNNEEVLMRIAKGIERKEMAARLRESERKLALSQLAVTINHEINSPLTVMIGNTEVLMDKKSEFSADTFKLLEKIIEAGNKIKNIVTRLRNINEIQVVKYADDATMIDLKTSALNENILTDGSTAEKKPAVLIADDEELILDLFHTVLEDRYEVHSVLNGEDLFKFLDMKYSKNEKIDLFFLDLYMPGLNGLEIFRKLKKMDANVKVCLITGYINDEMIAQALKEGALGYLYKPFKITDVLDFIQKVMVTV